MSDESEKKYIALGRVLERVLGLLAKVLPALFVYLMNRSKSKVDSLESQLSLKEKELDVAKAKEAVENANDKKSSNDIVNDFINTSDGG